MARSRPPRLSSLIFLTGLPRSGTTWAGRTIAAATGSMLLEEPFNYEFHPARRRFHMQYLPTGADADEYLQTLTRTIYSWKRPRRSLRILGSGRLLVRDVMTCLATAAIWERWQPLTIIMVRHPCAVADSWRRLDFSVADRLDLLLGQPRLLEAHLAPYVDHMQSSEDFFFQLGAYWGATYLVLQQLGNRHGAWHWVRHEALCAEPEAAYGRLLTDLGLSLGPGGVRFLRHNNRAPSAGASPFEVQRLTAREPDKWQANLTADQAAAVLAGAAPFNILTRFYPPAE